MLFMRLPNTFGRKRTAFTICAGSSVVFLRVIFLIFYGLKINILPLSAPPSILIWFINKSFPCPFILSVGRNKSNNLVFFKVTVVLSIAVSRISQQYIHP